ncbi:MAG TPA: transcriptional repressor [Candidatus Latescibacteria bacterium]|nr:transcriptional repressor [Candidatus Latescibacterota bacterium]
MIQQKVQLLKEKGIVVTIQRMAVLDALEEMAELHPTVEDLYRSLKGRYPTFSLATVYNTLEIFHKMGLVQELSFPKRERCYDPNTEPHPHFFCRVCGRVWDVGKTCPIPECPVLKIKNLGGKKVEGIQIYFYGVCQECRNSK